MVAHTFYNVKLLNRFARGDPGHVIACDRYDLARGALLINAGCSSFGFGKESVYFKLKFTKSSAFLGYYEQYSIGRLSHTIG